jgi:hypothetical protein
MASSTSATVNPMRLVFIMTATTIVTLVGCTTVPLHPRHTSASSEPTEPTASVTHPNPSISAKRTCCHAALPGPSRSAIVRTAATLVGAKTIASEGRRITYDCAGVTRAIFLKHGIDLYDGNAVDSDANGVRLIHAHMQQHGRLHQSPTPHPGDLVFFDNTWDFNGDGELNDPLTHVGVVEQIDPDGTVIFISRVAAAIQRYRMNLSRPHLHKTAEGRILNDYLRRKHPTDPEDRGRLTGELFSFFGTRLDF